MPSLTAARRGKSTVQPAAPHPPPHPTLHQQHPHLASRASSRSLVAKRRSSRSALRRTSTVVLHDAGEAMDGGAPPASIWFGGAGGGARAEAAAAAAAVGGGGGRDPRASPGPAMLARLRPMTPAGLRRLWRAGDGEGDGAGKDAARDGGMYADAEEEDGGVGEGEGSRSASILSVGSGVVFARLGGGGGGVAGGGVVGAGSVRSVASSLTSSGGGSPSDRSGDRLPAACGSPRAPLPRTRVFYDRGPASRAPRAPDRPRSAAFAGAFARFEDAAAAAAGDAGHLGFDESVCSAPDADLCGGQVEAQFWGAGACFLDDADDAYLSSGDEEEAGGGAAPATLRLAPRPRLPPLPAAAAAAPAAAAPPACSVAVRRERTGPLRALAPARRALSAMRAAQAPAVWQAPASASAAQKECAVPQSPPPAGAQAERPERQARSFTGNGVVARRGAPAGGDVALQAATAHRAEFEDLARAAADAHCKRTRAARPGLLAKIGRSAGRRIGRLY